MKSLVILVALVAVTVSAQTNGVRRITPGIRTPGAQNWLTPEQVERQQKAKADYDASVKLYKEMGQREAAFCATTNTATLAELQARGIDIKFREIAVVDYIPNPPYGPLPVLRKRWVLCSPAYGEPLHIVP